MNKKNLNIRRNFLKGIAWASLIPFGAAFNSMLDNMAPRLKKITFKGDLPAGVSFLENIIIYKSDLQISVLSAKCSHLGCAVKKIEGEKLICPCHGSVYDFNGNVIKGPAAENLKKLDFSFDSVKNEYSVIVKL